MSAELTPQETIQYSRIIDQILSKADLATVTRKKIRSALEDAVGADLSSQKTAIKVLIERRFDAISSQGENSLATPEEPTYSPAKRSAADYEDDLDAEGEDETPVPAPAHKKQKRERSIEDQDARLAAQLQAEENSLGRVRKTRGGTTHKPTKKATKKAARKKSKSKVDDSDVEGSENKPKRNTGFQKPFNLSPSLADLVGGDQMSRPQVVKKIWAHIKALELQDPSDKRQINCDDKMRAVFKTSKVQMFSMNKMLGDHLYQLTEEEMQKYKEAQELEVKAEKDAE